MEPMPMSTTTAFAVETVDQNARKALWGSAIGYAMDGFDMLILINMLGPISVSLGLVPAQTGFLVTSTLVGALIGGFIFGGLADRYGRVRVLTWTIVLFAVFTGLSALAQTYAQLLTARTIAGMGLGGEFGIGMALAAEAYPPSMRARVSSFVGLGWQTGVLVAAIITPLLLPFIGWRGMFAVGIAPALVAAFIRHSVDEPAVFLRSHARNALQPLKLLVADRATAMASLGMFILCSVQNFGYFGLMTWLPNYLGTQLGMGLTKSSTWIVVTILGMAAGIWAFGHLADRFGRRPTFLGYMIGAVVMVLIYSQLTDPNALLIGGAVLGFFVNGMLGGYGALMSELFPTAARATAQNVLFNLGRGVGGFGPVVIGLVVGAYGASTAIAMLAVLYGLDIVALLALIPERRGAALT
jgi:MFS family permease